MFVVDIVVAVVVVAVFGCVGIVVGVACVCVARYVFSVVIVFVIDVRYCMF